MDEDTLIALGFAVGAVVLLVIVFIWVIIYCVCCRKREAVAKQRRKEKRQKRQEHFRYISNTYNQRYNDPPPPESPTSTAKSHQKNRKLPELPMEDKSETKSHTPQPVIKTAGHTNQSFLASVEALYTYCDSTEDMPGYQAPTVPQNTHNYEKMSSSQAIFLEQKYNLKSDDADHVHNSRPLSSTSRTPITTPSSEPEAYADINSVFRNYSVLEKENNQPINSNCQDGTVKKESMEVAITIEPAPDLKCGEDVKDDSSSSTGEGHESCHENIDVTKPAMISSRECRVPLLSVTNEDYMNMDPTMYSSEEPTLRVRDIVTETHNNKPKDSLTADETEPEHMNLVDRNSLKEIEEISFELSVKDPITSGIGSNRYQLTVSTSLTSSTSVSDISKSKPIPKPRHSRSLSADHLSPNTDNSTDGEGTNEESSYTNLPPLPQPRLSENNSAVPVL